ncbi:MAG TPA: outer membrane protein transport protein [Holophagaceae bacterium]|nr:outer membrane protein transport protein [Holophagaceae bacterium]
MTKAFHSVVALALVGGASALSAQGVLNEGSDPVTISRAGVGVAFGRSLEAAGLNPALLVTLQEDRSAHVAFGLESQAGSVTAQNNQIRYFSSDRNRAIGAFGFAQRVNAGLSWGLKVDEPFERHLELRAGAPTRFTGDAISIGAHRLEGQAAWTPEGHPELSFGLGLGVTRLGFTLGNTVRAGIPVDPTQPESVINPYLGLAEVSLREEGSAFTPSWTLGARWALSSRWTLAATFESPLKAHIGLTARALPATITVTDDNGYGTPPVGTETRAYQLIGTSGVGAGSGDLNLPARATLGLRQRQSQLLTWEVDLQWMGAGLRTPGFANLQTFSGTVSAPANLESARSSALLKGMAEFTLSKDWTLRIGAGLSTGYKPSETTEPLLGGSTQSFASVGAGYKVWGGELNVGYQYRLDRDTDRLGAEGAWDSSGYRATGTKVRIEGAGHLMAIGFRKSF